MENGKQLDCWENEKLLDCMENVRQLELWENVRQLELWENGRQLELWENGRHPDCCPVLDVHAGTGYNTGNSQAPGRFHVKGPRKKVNVEKWIFLMRWER